MSYGGWDGCGPYCPVCSPPEEEEVPTHNCPNCGPTFPDVHYGIIRCYNCKEHL